MKQVDSHKKCVGLKSFSSLYIWVLLLISTLTVVMITINQHTYTNDLSSYIAPSISMLKNEGFLYRNYVNWNPPLMEILLYLWGTLFGLTLKSVYICYSINLFALLSSQYLIMKKYATKKVITIYLIIQPLILISSGFFVMLYPVDLVGLTFVFIAVVFVLYNKKDSKWLIAGYFFLFLAGLTKEVFFFTIISIPLLMVRSFSDLKKHFRFSIIAFLFSYFPIFIWLFLNHAVSNYVEMYKLKAAVFHFSLLSAFINPFREVSILMIRYCIPFFACFFVFLVISYFKKKSFYLRSNFFRQYIYKHSFIILIFFLVLEGFVYQGKPMKGHYALAIFPILLILIVSALNDLHPKVVFVLCFSLILPGNFTTIKEQYVNIYKNVSELKTNISAMESKENISKFHLDGINCLNVLYGWNPGSYLIYSKVPSCNRYFIPDMMVTNTKTINIYRSALFLNPPKFVLLNPGESDYPPKLFNQNVLHWDNILKHCYVQSGNSEHLYIIKDINFHDKKECLIKNGS